MCDADTQRRGSVQVLRSLCNISTSAVLLTDIRGSLSHQQECYTTTGAPRHPIQCCAGAHHHFYIDISRRLTPTPCTRCLSDSRQKHRAARLTNRLTDSSRMWNGDQHRQEQSHGHWQQQGRGLHGQSTAASTGEPPSLNTELHSSIGIES